MGFQRQSSGGSMGCQRHEFQEISGLFQGVSGALLGFSRDSRGFQGRSMCVPEVFFLFFFMCKNKKYSFLLETYVLRFSEENGY